MYLNIRSLRKIAPEVWQRLLPEDRRLFDRDHRALWDRYRHPIPLGAARPLMNMLLLGEVCIKKTSGKPVFQNGTFIIPGADAACDSVQAHYLIQATDLELDATRDRSQLIGAIVRRNLAQAHPGGGLRVDSNLRLQSSHGEVNDLFLMGSRTRGSTFATASIRSIARAGDVVAKELALRS